MKVFIIHNIVVRFKWACKCVLKWLSLFVMPMQISVQQISDVISAPPVSTRQFRNFWHFGILSIFTDLLEYFTGALQTVFGISLIINIFSSNIDIYFYS